jgi:anthranilate phosphoribosyltransferase
VSPEAFAPFVATLGRGPGRSRALTREEAREAFRMVLAGEVDPHQLGAFLMLLRYRGEDPDEVAGIVEAMQETLPEAPRADLDWPSYGAGRTRTLPWFLLAALALAQSGVRVLMHGTNEFGAAMPVAEALASLGLSAARDMAEAGEQLERSGFAYLPIAALAPGVANLLGLRRLFGLRSPVNTAARLLDPARAPVGVDGVFHPAYLDVHLGVAERLGRGRLAVLKGGGGEAERVPAKPGLAYLWDRRQGRAEIALPADPDAATDAAEVGPGLLAAVWRGEAEPPREVATIHATLALALIASGWSDAPEAVAADAQRIWRERRPLAANRLPGRA